MSRFITKEKLNYLFDELEKEKIDCLYLSDSEPHREVNVRYLTGHIEDAEVILDVNNRQIYLIPWDVQLAEANAEVDVIIDLADYSYSRETALIQIMRKIIDTRRHNKPTIAVMPETPYYKVDLLVKNLDIEITAKQTSTTGLLDKIRAIKSSKEISLLMESVKISNTIVDEMKNLVTTIDNSFTELDLAIFVENRMRKLGAEGFGFETLVASSKRSWMIHTYPRAHPNLPLNRPGLALIDFGVNAKGLTSDVTVPFSFGKRSKEMDKIVETVVNAYNAAIDHLELGVATHEVAQAADKIIKDAGYTMPHGLGHGIGLAVHDAPVLRLKPTNEILLKQWKPTILKEGMVITIEPGIYTKQHGGFRLENDVVMTSGKPKILTNSSPIFVD